MVCVVVLWVYLLLKLLINLEIVKIIFERWINLGVSLFLFIVVKVVFEFCIIVFCESLVVVFVNCKKGFFCKWVWCKMVFDLYYFVNVLVKLVIK